MRQKRLVWPLGHVPKGKPFTSTGNFSMCACGGVFASAGQVSALGRERCAAATASAEGAA